MWAESYTCLLFFTFGLHTSWSNTFCFQFCLGTHMEGQDKLECKGSIEKLLKNCNRFYPENCLPYKKPLFLFLYTLRILLAIPNAFGVYLVTLFFCCHTLCGICMESLDILKYALLLLCTKKCIPISCFCTIIQFSF